MKTNLSLFIGTVIVQRFQSLRNEYIIRRKTAEILYAFKRKVQIVCGKEMFFGSRNADFFSID